jgi:integrase
MKPPSKRRGRGIAFTVDRGQYVKSVGYAVSKLGNVSARRWYLGAVEDGEAEALGRYATIKQAWDQQRGVEQLDVNGKSVAVWQADFDPLNGSQSAPKLAAPAVETSLMPNALTVSQAAERYVAEIRKRFERGQVSHAYWANASYVSAYALSAIGGDKPLSSIGAAEVQDAVCHFASRPASKNKSNGEPVSVRTAGNYISVLRDFLDWASKTEAAPGSEIAIWRKPLRFDEIFRNNKPDHTQTELTQLLVDEEAEADAYTIDELTKLYSAANWRMRNWLAISLNAGFTQSEIGSLINDEVVGLETEQTYIRRARGKTKVFAKWPLWKETADLLRMHIAIDKRTKPGEPLIVTKQGLVLVEPGEGRGRNDRLAGAFDRLKIVLPEDRQLSFKYIRKSGARAIRLMPKDIGGDAVADMYLAHADAGSGKGSQLSAYSGRDWEQLGKALTELRRQLEPMFAAAPMSPEVAGFCSLPVAEGIDVLNWAKNGGLAEAAEAVEA